MEKSEELWDIDETETAGLQALADSADEEALTHMNGDYIVRVHFGKTDYSAADAIKHYLRQLAQLK